MNESGAVWDTLRDYGVEIRALKRRVEAFSAGDSIRADAIGGVIPAANVPVYWWYNGNLLGAGVKVDLRQNSRVWISGSFVAGRAYYDIGTYPDAWISGVDWNVNDGFVGWGYRVDYHAGAGVWISGTFVGGEAIITVGAYATGGGGASGTVGWYEHGGLIGYSLDVDFEPGNCVWISGTLVGGRPTYEVGVYPGCLGISGVDFAANGDPLCFGAGLDLQEEWGIWISGTCVGGKATYKVGAYLQPAASGAAGAGDDILALTYAVAF